MSDAREDTDTPPIWIRVILGLLGASAIVPTIILTLLAYGWRATEPGWLLPAALLVELGLVVALLTVGRGLRKRLVTAAYQRIRHPGLRLGLSLGLPLSLLALRATLSASLHEELPRSTTPAGDKKVAVVGAGAAGLHAGWMLDQANIDYTIYEADDRIGGHAHSVPFETESGEIFSTDVGFIFGAPRGYEEMKALLAHYGVGRTTSTASYSVSVGDESWATDAPHTLDPEALRFHELVAAHADDKSLNLVPFGWWLRWHGFDEDFRREYLTPLLTILFITADGIYECSTRFILATFHGQTKWVDFREGGGGWIVDGGSERYYQKLAAPLAERILLSTPVTALERVDGRVKLNAVGPGGEAIEEWYDEVILAVPADVARALLTDRTPWEDFILGEIRYKEAKVVLHTDQSVLPADASMRRNYNWYQPDEYGDEFELHGMLGETLGGGRTITPEPIGTVNPKRPLDDVRFERVWRHHRQDLWHLALATELMPALQGNGGVHYAGDWVQFIGHGQAIRMGLMAACRVGADASRAPELDPEAPCVEAVIQDPMPEIGVEATTQTLCGEAGVYQYLLKFACKR